MDASRRRIAAAGALILAGILLATLAGGRPDTAYARSAAVESYSTGSAALKDLPVRGAAMEDLPQMYPKENRELALIVIKTYREYRANATRWSFAYFGCVFGSALFSALAGLLLKLEVLGTWPRLRNDLAASLAMLAALLVTLSTTGDFHRKWQANRIAAASMENLAYELLRSSASRDAVVGQIQRINDARNKGIVGEQAESSTEGSKKGQTGRSGSKAPL